MAFADDDAQAEAFRRWRRPLVKLACYHLRDPALAEDVVQVVFVKCSRTPTLLERGKEYGFLREAVIQQCHTEGGRRGRVVPAGLDLEVVAHDRPSDRSSFEDAAWIIDPLPEQQRRALVLRFVEEMSANEVAAVLGITAGRVNHLVREARATLRKILRRRGNE
jgi:RNA polymerase sigma-70 factor (ECF subfamily)